MTLQRPPRLRPGDRVAALSLSWGGPYVHPHRYEAGKRQFEAAFDVEVVEFPMTLSPPELLAADPQGRAADLHAALVDDSVAGIVSTIGGDDSIRLLPHLDLELIASNPKVMLGYSDTTITLMAFLRAGVVGFYGPTIMSGFGENTGLHGYLADGVRRTLFEPESPLVWPENRDGWTVELLDWADPSHQQVARTLQPSTGWRWLQGSDAVEGPLVAGCFEVLDWLRGSAWWPELDGTVLALETSEEAPPPEAVARFLRSLALTGELERLAAIVFGRPGGAQLDPGDHAAYDEALLRIVRDENGLDELPIVANVDFGHTDPLWTLPIGVPTLVDPLARTITLLEAGVR